MSERRLDARELIVRKPMIAASFLITPVLQGEKFDAGGVHVRGFAPELARFPARYHHRPWEAPGPKLAKADVKSGRTYPPPIADHTGASQRALSAYQSSRDRQ